MQMVEVLSLLFWHLLPFHSVIHTRNGIFGEVTWLPGLSPAGFLGRKRVSWADTGYELDLNIVSYIQTWSIGWMSVMLLAASCLLDSDLAMLKWELWPVRHRVCYEGWMPTCSSIWKSICCVMASGIRTWLCRLHCEMCRLACMMSM